MGEMGEMKNNEKHDLMSNTPFWFFFIQSRNMVRLTKLITNPVGSFILSSTHLTDPFIHSAHPSSSSIPFLFLLPLSNLKSHKSSHRA